MNQNRSQNWTYHRILDQKPTKVYLSLGSNLGDREANLAQARELLKSTENQILKASSIYETEPVDCKEGNFFLNQVLYVVTLLKPEQLLNRLHKIESEMGRERTEKNAPRTIDLDILLFDDHVIAEPELQIPHPRMHERRFVLEPLNEINPLIWHPVFNQSVQALLSKVTDQSVQILGAAPKVSQVS